MAPLRYAAKFDPFLSLDCTPTPSTLAQSKERKGSNFCHLAILVLGHLLSPEFVSKSRVTGAYSPTDFQFAAPEWDAPEMLPVLEALAVCAQCQSDGTIEYEFPCFNVLSADPDSLWPRDVGAEFGAHIVYGGVMLKARWVRLLMAQSVAVTQ